MSSTITLSDILIINQIEEQFSQLSTQFDEAENEIILDASGVDTVDTSGLQSLLVLIQNAQNNGKQINWQSPSETLTASAAKLGLSAALKLES